MLICLYVRTNFVGLTEFHYIWYETMSVNIAVNPDLHKDKYFFSVNKTS